MLIDLRHIPAWKANEAVDRLCKSMEDAMSEDFHPTDNLIGHMENAMSRPVRRALLNLHDRLLTMLVTANDIVMKAEIRGQTKCQKLEQRIMQAKPGSLKFGDYLDVLDCLLERYLPGDVLSNQMQTLAVKQYVAGHLRAASPLPETVTALLATSSGDLTTLLSNWKNLKPYQLAMMDAAKANAARLITDLKASARSRIQKVIIDAQKHRIAVDGDAFMPAPLVQQLSDTFGDLNRDWRRIAVSETAMNSADGFLATMVPGEYVKWLAHEGCCDYCKSMNGTIYEVADPKHAYKNTATQVWAGKHLVNVGRSISKRKRLEDGTMADRPDYERVVPAIPSHPNCRCIYVPSVKPTESA